MVIALLVLCPLILLFLTDPNLVSWKQWAWLIVSSLLGVLLFLCIGFYFMTRWKYRIHYRAVRLAQAGDVEGAIALLHEHMRDHEPTALCCNNLAVFYGMQNKWDEALRMVEQAEALSSSQPGLLATKGLALWKLGRTQEALPCLEEAQRRNSADLLVTCNYGSLLAELRRHAEARELLRHADHLIASQTVIGAANRQTRDQALKEFRQRVSGNGVSATAEAPENGTD